MGGWVFAWVSAILALAFSAGAAAEAAAVEGRQTAVQADHRLAGAGA